MKNFKLSAIFVFLFFLSFTIYLPLRVNAFLAPGIYVKDLKINGMVNNEINGDFIISNYEGYYMSDLNYEIKLFKGTSFDKLEQIDSMTSKEIFFVQPKGTTTKSFVYNYPQNITSGDYTVRIQIITGRGNELGWQDQIIHLKGNNKFLNIIESASKVLTGGKEYSVFEGVNVSSKDEVIGLFKIENPGKANTVIPHIKIFQRQTNMPVVKEYQDSPITFAKGEAKVVRLTMPKIDVPESYLAEVKLYSGDEQVSGIQYFRWVVKGESGKIIYLQTDKDYFKANKDIDLTILSIGPADGNDIGTGKLEIIISDKNGNFVTQISKDIPLNYNIVTSKILIPIKSDLVSPQISAKLVKGNKILDERLINLPIFSPEAQQIQKQQIEEKQRAEQFKKMLPVYFYGFALFIIILLILVILLYKFKIKK